MSVRLEQGLIYLEGRCPAEDADDLLCALLNLPEAQVDLTGVQRLHMAVVQVLLSASPSIRGKPSGGPLSNDILLHVISNGDSTQEFS